MPTTITKESPKLEAISLRDFKGGLRLDTSPEYLADNEVQDCQNVLFDEVQGAAVKRKGFVDFSTLPIDKPVLRLYQYVKTDGTIFIIAQIQSGEIYQSVDRVNWTLLTELTEGAIADFETFENVLWITNGVDSVRIWDGTTLSILTFVFKGKFIKVHQERVFVSGGIDEPSEIRFSRFYNDAGVSIKPYQAEAWVEKNQLMIGADDGTRNTGLAVYFGNLVSFKEKSIWVVSGWGAERYAITRLSSTIGTFYHWSIKLFKNLLIFLGHDGIYTFNGRTVDKISDKIRPLIETIQQILVRLLQWSQTITADFEAGAITNLATRGTAADTLRIPNLINPATGKMDTTTADFEAGTEKTNIDTAGDELKIILGAEEKILIGEYTVSTGSDTGGDPYDSSTVGFNDKNNAADDNWENFAYGRLASHSASEWPTLDIYALYYKPNIYGPFILLRNLRADVTDPITETFDDLYVRSGQIQLFVKITHQGYIKNMYLTLGFDRSYIKKIVIKHQIYMFSGEGGVIGIKSFPFEIEIHRRKYSLTATFISREFNTECKDGNYVWGNFVANHSIPNDTSIKYEIGTSSSSGGTYTWQDLGTFTSGSSVSLLPTIARNRYIKYRAYLTSNGINTPIIYDVTQNFTLTDTWISKKQFLGDVTAYRTFISDYDKKGKTLNLWYRTATSSVGLDTATWREIDHNQVPILALTGLNIWAQFKAYFLTDIGTITPILYSMIMPYYTGGFPTQEAVAVINKDRYLLSVATAGSIYNNLVIVLDNNGAWTKFTGMNFSSFTEYGQDLLGGFSQEGKIFQLFTGNNDLTSLIDAYFVTKDLTFNLADNLKRLRNIWVNADRVADYDLDVSYSFDSKPETTISTSIIADGVLNKRLSVSAGSQGKIMRIKFRNNKLNQIMQVKGVEIYYMTLPLRNI